MSLIIVLLIGVVIGMLVSRFIFREKPVGSLRVDESDPDSGPYLFLELDRSGADAIYKQRYVRLRVELKNYISHKEHSLLWNEPNNYLKGEQNGRRKKHRRIIK